MGYTFEVGLWEVFMYVCMYGYMHKANKYSTALYELDELGKIEGYLYCGELEEAEFFLVNFNIFHIVHQVHFVLSLFLHK